MGKHTHTPTHAHAHIGREREVERGMSVFRDGLYSCGCALSLYQCISNAARCAAPFEDLTRP